MCSERRSSADVFDEFVHVERMLVRRTARAQQGIDEIGETIRLADHNVRVLGQFLVLELSCKQLRGAAYASERVLDFVCELANHLPDRKSTRLNSSHRT